MSYLPPNAGRMNVTLGGNTAGAMATVSTGTMGLIGGSNITLSQAGNVVTINGATNGLTSQSNQALSAGNGSFAFQTASFSNANGISFSTSAGSAIVASHDGLTSQSGQALSGSNGSFAFQTATFGSSNGMHFYTTNGSLVGSYTVPNVPAQTNQTLGMYATGANTTGQSSSNTLDARSFSISAQGGLYAGMSGNTLQLSAATTYAASNHSHGNPTLNLTNLNGTTASASNGLTLSLSAAAQTAQTLGLYATGANTTGESSSNTLDARSFSISAQGGLYAGMSGNTLQLSAATTYAASNHSHGNPTLNLTNLSGTTASASNGLTLSLSAAAPGAGAAISAAGASASNGTVVFSNSNGIGFGMNGSTVTASYTVPTQTNQTIGLYATGANTTGESSSNTFDARSFSISAQGGLYAGMSGNTLQLSAATTYAASNHSHGNPTLNLTNLSGTTASASNGLTLSLSAAAQSVQTQGLHSVTIGSNTAGVGAAISSGEMTLAGGSNITLSQNGGNALTIHGASGGGVALSASDATFGTGTVELAKAGGALTIGTAAQEINFSVPATSQLSGIGAVNISTNGSTINISAPLLSNWIHNSAGMYSSSTSAMVNGTLSLVRMLIPEAMSFSRVDVPVSVSGATSATANTAAMAISAVGVIYRRSVSTLTPIVGLSSTTTYSYASNTGVYSSVTGARLLSFNLATTINPGEYYLGFQLSTATSSVGTATTNLGWTVAPIYGTSYTAVPFQDMSAVTNATINPYQPLMGLNSATISNTTQTIQQSQITQTGTALIRPNLIVVLRNQ